MILRCDQLPKFLPPRINGAFNSSLSQLLHKLVTNSREGTFDLTSRHKFHWNVRRKWRFFLIVLSNWLKYYSIDHTRAGVRAYFAPRASVLNCTRHRWNMRSPCVRAISTIVRSGNFSFWSRDSWSLRAPRAQMERPPRRDKGESFSKRERAIREAPGKRLEGIERMSEDTQRNANQGIILGSVQLSQQLQTSSSPVRRSADLHPLGSSCAFCLALLVAALCLIPASAYGFL